MKSVSWMSYRSGRARFLLRGAADINGLLLHLVTHFKTPHIEVAVGAFSRRAAHRARARVARLSAASGITLGGVLAFATLMFGTASLVWTYDRRLTSVNRVALAVLCAGMIGWVVALLWARLALVLEICLLRYRASRPQKELEPPLHAQVNATPNQQVHFDASERLTVVSKLTDLHIEQLHRLYQREWWSSDRSLYATRRCVLGSQVVIGMVNESDELVAFARVLTDYTFKAMIFDVIVAESVRHHGLGRKLVDLVTGHEALRQVRHFELYCLPEVVGFYTPHGFTADVGSVQLLRRVRPELNAVSGGSA